ncbi:MAG: hypothetical protein VXY77_00790 [Pseudomonadota bacterium]|nr:hypothetical protein [Pseudomonadota bacterium]
MPVIRQQYGVSIDNTCRAQTAMNTWRARIGGEIRDLTTKLRLILNMLPQGPSHSSSRAQLNQQLASLDQWTLILQNSQHDFGLTQPSIQSYIANSTDCNSILLSPDLPDPILFFGPHLFNLARPNGDGVRCFRNHLNKNLKPVQKLADQLINAVVDSVIARQHTPGNNHYDIRQDRTITMNTEHELTDTFVQRMSEDLNQAMQRLQGRSIDFSTVPDTYDSIAATNVRGRRLDAQFFRDHLHIDYPLSIPEYIQTIMPIMEMTISVSQAVLDNGTLSAEQRRLAFQFLLAEIQLHAQALRIMPNPVDFGRVIENTQNLQTGITQAVNQASANDSDQERAVIEYITSEPRFGLSRAFSNEETNELIQHFIERFTILKDHAHPDEFLLAYGTPNGRFMINSSTIFTGLGSYLSTQTMSNITQQDTRFILSQSRAFRDLRDHTQQSSTSVTAPLVLADNTNQYQLRVDYSAEHITQLLDRADSLTHVVHWLLSRTHDGTSRFVFECFDATAYPDETRALVGHNQFENLSRLMNEQLHTRDPVTHLFRARDPEKFQQFYEWHQSHQHLIISASNPSIDANQLIHTHNSVTQNLRSLIDRCIPATGSRLPIRLTQPYLIALVSHLFTNSTIAESLSHIKITSDIEALGITRTIENTFTPIIHGNMRVGIITTFPVGYRPQEHDPTYTLITNAGLWASLSLSSDAQGYHITAHRVIFNSTAEAPTPIEVPGTLTHDQLVDGLVDLITTMTQETEAIDIPNTLAEIARTPLALSSGARPTTQSASSLPSASSNRSATGSQVAPSRHAHRTDDSAAQFLGLGRRRSQSSKPIHPSVSASTSPSKPNHPSLIDRLVLLIIRLISLVISNSFQRIVSRMPKPFRIVLGIIQISTALPQNLGKLLWRHPILGFPLRGIYKIVTTPVLLLRELLTQTARFLKYLRQELLTCAVALGLLTHALFKTCMTMLRNLFFGSAPPSPARPSKGSAASHDLRPEASQSAPAPIPETVSHQSHERPPQLATLRTF